MGLRWRLIAGLLMMLGAAASWGLVDPFGGSAPRSQFLDVDEAFVFSAERMPDGATRLHWQIEPGHYLYRERLTFSGLAAADQPLPPRGEPHRDEYFGETEIYRYGLEVMLPAGVTGPITVGWQGCADAGLCYPPQQRTLTVGEGGASPVTAPAGEAVAEEAADQSLARQLQEQGLGPSLVIFFGLGLLLAFTPCSLPMLPILASVVVGSGAGPRRSLVLAASYTVSMALVYAGLGVAAALAGASLQGWLQQPWLLGTFAGLFVLLALPLFGLFELQLPLRLRDALDRLGRGRRGGTVIGASALGLLSGLLVGPCMTAPLAAALLFIARSGDLLSGGLALFALGLGMGLPLILVVTVGNRLLPKPGAWMDRIKVVFGFLLLGTAIFLLRPVVAGPLWLALWGLLLIGAATALHELARPGSARAPLGALGLAALLWGAALLAGAAAGASDPWRPLAVYAATGPRAPQPADRFVTFSSPDVMETQLAQARAKGEWVLVDYYADWCVSCKVMEREVFGDPRVQEALADVRLLRPDVTANGADSRALLASFEVAGPPTLLWIGPDGRERRGARLVGEISAGAFIDHWQKLRGQG